MRKFCLLSPAGGCYGSSAGVNPPAGFSSLIALAGSRLVSVKRYFCTRNPSCDRIMAGRDGGAFALAGSQSTGLLTPLRLATPFSSVVTRLHKLALGAVNMADSAHPLHLQFSAISVQGGMRHA